MIILYVLFYIFLIFSFPVYFDKPERKIRRSDTRISDIGPAARATVSWSVTRHTRRYKTMRETRIMCTRLLVLVRRGRFFGTGRRAQAISDPGFSQRAKAAIIVTCFRRRRRAFDKQNYRENVIVLPQRGPKI